MNGRLASLDVARGFDMLWIMGLSELVVKVCAALGYGPESAVAAQMEHLHWEGLHFIDLVFPTFLFIAGISFPYSLAKQRERGLSTGAVLKRIWRRVFVLFALGLVYNGILCRGPGNVVWGSVLARIGFGWGLAATLTVLVESVRVRVLVCAATLLGYWALCLFVGAPDNPTAGSLTLEGCFAGWVDRMVLPGKLTHPGVLSAQGVVPTLPGACTALLGIFTGEYVRQASGSGERKSATMLAASVGLALAGLLVAFGCGAYSFPIIKKIWSTSYVLVCAGYSLALFAICYFLIDVRGWWKRHLFFQVIGLNAITIYLAQAIVGFHQAKELLFGWLASLVPGGWNAVVLQAGYVILCWCFLYFLHRRKIYFKV